MGAPLGVTAVVGVDGSGRTHRLRLLAAEATVPVWWAVGPPAEMAAGLTAARSAKHLVVVDDAHRLDPAALRDLAAAARAGVPMVISRRPTIDRPELAELDEAIAAGSATPAGSAVAGGGAELLGALDRDGVARLVAMVTGRPVSPEVAAAVFEASAGLPAVAAAVATAPSGAPPPALLARVQRRFALLDQDAVTVARVLALRLDLADHVLATATGLDLAGLATVLRTLRDEGLLVPDGEGMIPAVAAAVLGELPAAERRRIHDAVAGALVAAGTDPVAAARQLRAARASTPVAAVVYREAGERLRFTDPAAAIGWFDDAADAGVDPATLAAGRAEAGALLGLPVEVDPFTLAAGGNAAAALRPSESAAGPRPGEPVAGLGPGGSAAGRGGLGPGGSAAGPGGRAAGLRAGEPAAGLTDAGRIALVAGAVAAHQGRTARAADLLLAAPVPGPALAVPSLVGTGRIVPARAAADSPAPAALARLAEGALVAAEPAVALPLLIEAAEAMDRGAPTVVLPDTPHALGAVVAVAAGDVASAEHLLSRAEATGVGGPVAGERHRLLLAWARMRAGRYDTALHELQHPAGAEPGGRERLLRAALAAGIARRRGDIAGLRDAWSGIEPLLARRTADLWLIEAVEELAVAAARLRNMSRVEPVLALLDDILTGLGRPVTWSVSLEWLRLQTAIVTEDAAAADRVAGRLATVTSAEPRPLAQCTAATRWAAVLAGRVDPDAVLAATDDLVAAQLPWEASRLAGQAAIRTGDPTAARRLLERARELSEPDTGSGAAAAATLSEREVTVARLVLAGSTHREIGAQLYIAPKTVEHHVARIRGKLGANTRAELLAMLREMLDG